MSNSNLNSAFTLPEPPPPPKPEKAITASSGTYFYEAPLRVLRAIASAQRSEDALEVLFRYMSKYYGLRALELEVIQGPTSHFRHWGDEPLLKRVQIGHPLAENVRVYSCPMNEPTAPLGQMTYVLNTDSQATGELMEATTQQIALRLGQETLVKRAEDAEAGAWQRISEVSAIYEIGQAIDRTELTELLQLITERAALLMEAQSCTLLLMFEGEELRRQASYGLPDAALQAVQHRGEGLAGRVAQMEQPVRLPAMLRDPHLKGLQLYPEAGSAMFVPMKSQEESVIGVLCIRRLPQAPPFTEDDQRLFSVFATQAALAVTNIRLYDALKHRADELATISSLSRSLISTLNQEELLERIVSDIQRVVGFDRCCLYYREISPWEPNRIVYVLKTWRGYSDSLSRNPMREGEGAIGTIARNKRALVFDTQAPVPTEKESEASYQKLKGFARALGTDVFVAIPILTGRNKCIGVVVADNRTRRLPISKQQQSLLTAFVSQAGIVLENARLYEKTNNLNTYTDSVLESIPAAIVSTDAQGRIARWNRAAQELVQRPAAFFRNAVLTDTIAGLQLPEQERQELLQMIRHVEETGERISVSRRTLHPQGREPLTLNWKISQLPSPENEQAGIVFIFEDVTQEASLASEVENMRRLADIGQFAAKMAHEVRNALVGIKGAAQIIKETMGDFAEFPNIIIAEAEGLNRMTIELLDFARPAQVDPRPIFMDALLKGVVQTLEGYLAEHRVTVCWSLPTDLPQIEADAMMLKQAVRNLVMNAAQAMVEGGDIFLSVAHDEEHHRLELVIRDTGEGIPSKDQERIFRPFFTTRTKGTGLGLPIVSKIVRLHGGTVDVESEPKQGTKFTIRLPLRASRNEADVIFEPPIISPWPTERFPDPFSDT